MNVRKSLENRIRGWLPKEPLTRNLSPTPAPQSSLFRLGSLVLPAIGTALIAVFRYSILLIFYDMQLAASSRMILFGGFLVGIELAIIGASIRTKLAPEKPAQPKKPMFAVGLALLTLGVCGYIFDGFSALLNATITPYSSPSNSVLVSLLAYSRTGLFNLCFLGLAIAGCVFLIVNRTLSLKSSEAGRREHYRGYKTLTVGAVITSANLALLLVTSFVFQSYFGPLPLSIVLFGLYFLVEPLGILCLAIGWVTVTASASRRKPVLFPALFAVFVALTSVAFLVPI
jgi:hypothetical protein